MSSSMAATEPAAANSVPKKNNKKKKKNANKNKDVLENSNSEAKEQEGEPEGDSDPEPVTAHETSEQVESTSNGHLISPNGTGADDSTDSPTAKLDAISASNEVLRLEVEEYRKQLESLRASHQHEVSQLKSELEESNTAKEDAEEQYQTLLERVEKIKQTLGDRLKRDKAELEEARERIEELETQNEELQNSATSTDGDVKRLTEELQDATREVTALRSRGNLSSQNWQKEKDDLTRTLARLKEEMGQTTNAMGEWEVIAMEERSMKENLQDKISDYEEQVASLKEGYERTAADRDSQTTLVDNLQNALREIQEARKKELREMVESTEAQISSQKEMAQSAERRADEADAAKGELSKELERTAPFEKEVKEKNLLIGKLRHEAIVLNDHLTKALRYLKKTKPEDNVDRQIVTNHLLHFLNLDRSDAKRFQVLQVIAGYLNWSEEQREQAGLSRPGATASNSLRLPTSPFHRTPSSPSLSADLFSEPGVSTRDKESLAELWAGFLERSALEGAEGRPAYKRTDSGGGDNDKGKQSEKAQT